MEYIIKEENGLILNVLIALFANSTFSTSNGY